MPTNMVQANPDIRPLGPLTDADKPALLDAFAKGLSTKEAARKTGLSENQVVRGKKRFGIVTTPPDYQVAASEAFATKARRERHARREKWERIANRLLDELEEDFTSGKVVTILRGAMGIEGEETVTKIPSRDLRERLAAVNVAEVQIQKIDALEDDQGLARGLSMLETFTQAAAALVGGTLPAPREGLIQE